MGIKLSDLEPGDPITIICSTDMGEINIQAFIQGILKEEVAVIDVVFEDNRRLNFDNVNLSIEYAPEDGVPFIWRNARIVYLKSKYVLQVAGDGVKHNRRDCYRVSVGVYAKMSMEGMRPMDVMIRDVSLSGFAISDRLKELGLEIGQELTVMFEDLGYKLKLFGRVVRIEEMDSMTVYGLETRNLCKDLSTYISVKQQRNRKSKELKALKENR